MSDESFDRFMTAVDIGLALFAGSFAGYTGENGAWPATGFFVVLAALCLIRVGYLRRTQ